MNMKKSIAALAVVTLLAGSTASVSARCRRRRCCVSRCQTGNCGTQNRCQNGTCRPQNNCQTGNCARGGCANGRCGIRSFAQLAVLKCRGGRCSGGRCGVRRTVKPAVRQNCRSCQGGCCR